MAKFIASAEEALEILGRLRALSELGELTSATLETAVDELTSFVQGLPSEEDELKRLSEVFEEGSEALSHELMDSAYHPQSTGVFNPYDYELRQIAYDREKKAEGWILSEELLSEEFEVPEGMEIEWENRNAYQSKWGRLVEISEPDIQFHSAATSDSYSRLSAPRRSSYPFGGRLG